MDSGKIFPLLYIKRTIPYTFLEKEFLSSAFKNTLTVIVLLFLVHSLQLIKELNDRSDKILTLKEHLVSMLTRRIVIFT